MIGRGIEPGGVAGVSVAAATHGFDSRDLDADDRVWDVSWAQVTLPNLDMEQMPAENPFAAHFAAMSREDAQATHSNTLARLLRSFISFEGERDDKA